MRALSSLKAFEETPALTGYVIWVLYNPSHGGIFTVLLVRARYRLGRMVVSTSPQRELLAGRGGGIRPMVSQSGLIPEQVLEL